MGALASAFLDDADPDVDLVEPGLEDPGEETGRPGLILSPLEDVEAQNLEGIIGLRERRVVDRVVLSPTERDDLARVACHLLFERQDPDARVASMRQVDVLRAAYASNAAGVPPVAVVRLPSGRLVLRDGNHRVAAARLVDAVVLAIVLEA